MTERAKPTTAICDYTADAIYIRDMSLVDDLIGQVNFTQMIYFQILGRMPSDGETRILDSVLVTLMEHGMTPSAIATRLIAMSAPEAMQGAVAAGLLGVGGQFVGTMEGAARILSEILDADEGVESAAARIAQRYRDDGDRLPGFGHNLHRPDDPRTPKLLQVAEAAGVDGRYISALRVLGSAVDAAYGKHITINATGAIAAVLLEIDVPWEIMRGFAVITRAAGLVGHVREEQLNPAARHIWLTTHDEIEYSGAALKK
ncbi:MAG: citryl-CoA lyase [Gammaproteobacteria bacterium]|nr:citryl-CoA lyase [Gammaproteobacteria bacterium]